MLPLGKNKKNVLRNGLWDPLGAALGGPVACFGTRDGAEMPFCAGEGLKGHRGNGLRGKKLGLWAV